MLPLCCCFLYLFCVFYFPFLLLTLAVRCIPLLSFTFCFCFCFANPGQLWYLKFVLAVCFMSAKPKEKGQCLKPFSFWHYKLFFNHTPRPQHRPKTIALCLWFDCINCWNGCGFLMDFLFLSKYWLLTFNVSELFNNQSLNLLKNSLKRKAIQR